MCLCTNINNTDEFEEERVLSININKKPAFENDVYNLWRKDLEKLNTLDPIATYRDNFKHNFIQKSSRRSALLRDFIHATPNAESSCEKLLHKFQFSHCLFFVVVVDVFFFVVVVVLWFYLWETENYKTA